MPVWGEKVSEHVNTIPRMEIDCSCLHHVRFLFPPQADGFGFRLGETIDELDRHQRAIFVTGWIAVGFSGTARAWQQPDLNELEGRRS